MDSTQFQELVDEVFDEYLPNVNKTKRENFIRALISELRDRGLEIDLAESETENNGFADDD